MKSYCFYDSDESGYVDCELVGEEHQQLIKTCCKYCTTMAFVFTGPDQLGQFQAELAPYEILPPTAIGEDDYPLGFSKIFRFQADGSLHRWSSHTKFYRVCPELCVLLLSITDSLFSWLDGWGFCNPENPTFYRSDGSVFFSSVIHEGVCTLNVRDDEDASEIIRNPLWIEKK